MKNEVEVKVTYRFGKEPPPPPEPPVTGEIEIEIYIEKVEGGWRFAPACASLPLGVHRVYWIPTGPDSPVIDHLWITQQPPRVHELEPPKEITPAKWTAVYENPGVEGVNSIAYTFAGKNEKGEFGPPNFQHDPTIAVTNDPPPGHYLS